MGAQRPITALQRRAARARVNVVAHAQRGGARCGPYTVESLSVSGAVMVAETPWALGENLVLELALDAATPLTVHATVVRVEPRRGALGIALQFQALAPEAHELIVRVVSRALDATRSRGTRSVVAVTSRMEDIRALCPAVVQCAVEPLVATTFLDALRWLQDPLVWVVAFVVDVRADGELGLDMLAWCADEFPAVARALICRPDDVPTLTGAARAGHFTLLPRPIDLGVVGTLASSHPSLPMATPLRPSAPLGG